MIGEQIAFGLIAAITLAGGLFAVTAQRTFHSVMGLGLALVGVAALFIQMGSPVIGIIQVLVYVGGILTLFVFAVMFVAGNEDNEEASQRLWRDAPLPSWASFLVWVVVVVEIGGFLFLGVPQTYSFVRDFMDASLFVELLAVLAMLVLVAAATAIGVALSWVGFGYLLYKSTFRSRIGILTALVAFGAIAFAVSATAPWQEDGAGGAEDIDAIVTDLFTDHVVAFEVLGILLTAAMIGALVIARPLTGGLDSAHYPKGKDMAGTQAVSDIAATFAAPARMTELLGEPQTLDDEDTTQEEE